MPPTDLTIMPGIVAALLAALRHFVIILLYPQSLSSIKEPREVRSIIEHEELTRNLSICSNISRVNNNWR